MRTLEVSRALLGIRKNATYQEHVIRFGHIPGTLSGAELQGAARRHSSYFWTRERLIRKVRRHYSIDDDTLLLGKPQRWTRVWALDRDPVRLKLAP